jgi:hypothetical protein
VKAGGAAGANRGGSLEEAEGGRGNVDATVRTGGGGGADGTRSVGGAALAGWGLAIAGGGCESLTIVRSSSPAMATASRRICDGVGGGASSGSRSTEIWSTGDSTECTGGRESLIVDG